MTSGTTVAAEPEEIVNTTAQTDRTGASASPTSSAGKNGSPRRSRRSRKTPQNSPTASSRGAPTGASPTRDALASRADLNPGTPGSGAYDLEFGGRDSVASMRREVETIQQQTNTAFYRDLERDIHVFDEPPHVRVLGGRTEDAWPTRYVEYDVELKYKNYTWQVEIPKSTIYGLWFYIKSKVPFLSNPAHGSHSQGAGNPISASLPQLRRLFLANAEKSVSPEMVVLVQQCLEAVVKVPRLLSSAYVVSMFQVSNSTFDEEEGYTSIREGWLKVRFWLKGNTENVRINRGQITCDNECFNCMCVVKRVNFKSKKSRWVALKHNSIAVFSSIQDTNATESFLFDQKFRIERGIQSAGSNTALLVSNSTYVLQLEAKSKQSILKWANAIRKTAERCDWAQSHRDESFSIPRSPHQYPSYAQWFVDGKDAYESIYAALHVAKKEIFIAGWWICPTIHLLRPAALHPHSRLDQVIKKKAEEGVKVYILMYKEVSVALTLNSYFSKQVFSKLHNNVHVLRDPDFIMKQLGMWSHHEKIVCVDQKVSFVGGLDLCFGRWDTHGHELFDQPDQPTNFVGKDYSNPRVKDFIDVHQPETDLIDRDEIPRMPWHDCHCRLEGQPARDVARHFIQRWNYSVSTRRKSSKLHHLVPMKDYARAEKNDLNPRYLAKRLHKAVHAVRALHGLRTSSMGPEQEGRAQGFGTGSPRPTSKQLHRGFDSDRRLSRILSNSDVQESASFRDTNQQLNDRDDGSDREDNASDLEDLSAKNIAARGYPCYSQILRSISLWSGGVPTERSIHNAYIRLISSANHFIYIENQFFVSGLEGDPYCSNRIANALVERIRRAAANRERFRVMIVIPLLPAFPGKPEDKDASSLRGVMYWQYRSICRGENSIYHTLFRELDGDPFEYIAFYGLRAHSIVGDQPKTEEVYIHSKIMIVDDRSCIIGSANINERSMKGDRDSEVAVLLEDSELDESVHIANGMYTVGRFCHSFRMKLFQEHFGVEPGTPLYKKYSDPVNKDAWFTMQDHAMRNSQIYESVFGCLPSDSVVSFKQLNMDGSMEVKRESLAQAAKQAIQQHSPKRRSRGESATTSAGTRSPNAALSPTNNASSPTSGAGSPTIDELGPKSSVAGKKHEHKAMPSPLSDDVVNDNQVEAMVGSMKSLQSKNVSSPTHSNADGSCPDEQDEANDVVGELPNTSMHDKSAFFSGAITRNLRESSQILDRKDELRNIQGHIVYFPLKFLAEEALEPKLFPAELFQ